MLERYTPDGFTLALAQAIAQAKPDLVAVPHTYQVRDFAPKLAASLGKGMIGDCIGYRYENGRLIFVRQMFQGKTAADVTLSGASPWFASFPGRRFRGDQAGRRGVSPPDNARRRWSCSPSRFAPRRSSFSAKPSRPWTSRRRPSS